MALITRQEIVQQYGVSDEWIKRYAKSMPKPIKIEGRKKKCFYDKEQISAWLVKMGKVQKENKETVSFINIMAGKFDREELHGEYKKLLRIAKRTLSGSLPPYHRKVSVKSDWQ